MVKRVIPPRKTRVYKWTLLNGGGIESWLRGKPQSEDENFGITPRSQKIDQRQITGSHISSSQKVMATEALNRSS